MHKSPVLKQKDFAREALIAAASQAKVGHFIDVVQDDQDLASYLFASTQKGYVGWRWSVTIFQADASEPATVTEIALIPGPDSLVAPAWVPWSERLAEYKALQVETETGAEAEAGTSEQTGDSETSFEAQEGAEQELDDSVESAVSDPEPSEDAEGDSETAGRKPPRFLRLRKGFKIKKADSKGKGPKD